jgi:predicted lipid-binding transport protein (Tim44 family)
MAGSQLLEIVLIASVAGFLLFRLYSVLGRRTGHERPPQDGYRFGAKPDALNAPAKPLIPAAAANRPNDPVASGLFDIALADRSFDKDQFLKGARSAYEMILTAFAAGDRAALQPLLSTDVYSAFDAAIGKREHGGEKATLTLVGFTEVKIVAASLKASTAEVTLAYDVQLISATTKADGTVVEGDPKAVRQVTDVWTFSRDVRARDPNWTLVATSSEAR